MAWKEDQWRITVHEAGRVPRGKIIFIGTIGNNSKCKSTVLSNTRSHLVPLVRASPTPKTLFYPHKVHNYRQNNPCHSDIRVQGPITHGTISDQSIPTQSHKYVPIQLYNPIHIGHKRTLPKYTRLYLFQGRMPIIFM